MSCNELLTLAISRTHFYKVRMWVAEGWKVEWGGGGCVVGGGGHMRKNTMTGVELDAAE